MLPLIVLGVAAAVGWLADVLSSQRRLATGLAVAAMLAQLVSFASIAPRSASRLGGRAGRSMHAVIYLTSGAICFIVNAIDA